MAKPSGSGLVTLGKGFLLFLEDDRAGYEDFLEIDNFKFNTSVEKAEKYSNRQAAVIKLASTVKQINVNGSFTVACSKLDLIRFFGLSTSVTDVSQSSSSLADVAYSVYLGRWTKINYVKLSAYKVLKAGVSCVFDQATDVFTAVAHGMENGQKVELSGTAVPTGFAVDTTYYVVNKAADTFQLSATLGGAAVDGSDAGTAVVFHLVYTDGTDYEVDTDKGLLWIPASGSAITNAQSVLFSGAYAAQAMYQMEGATKNEIGGELEFYGDPAAGVTQDFFATVLVSPEGDFEMISEEYQTWQLNFECVANTALRTGLYTLRDRSGLSAAVAAV